jgi:hypothetical protein
VDHGYRPRSPAAGQRAPGRPPTRAPGPRRHDRPARLAHRRAPAAGRGGRAEVVLRPGAGRPAARRAAPPGPPASAHRRRPTGVGPPAPAHPRRAVGPSGGSIKAASRSAGSATPGGAPGRACIATSPWSRSSGAMPSSAPPTTPRPASPPAVTCPPRGAPSWPPCSSLSPARPARPASTCPPAPARLSRALAHPPGRPQSSAKHTPRLHR